MPLTDALSWTASAFIGGWTAGFAVFYPWGVRAGRRQRGKEGTCAR